MNFSNLTSFIIKMSKFLKKWWLEDVYQNYFGKGWNSKIQKIQPNNDLRIIIKSLTEEGLLFQGMLAESLEVSNKFPPNFFSQLVKAADEG